MNKYIITFLILISFAVGINLTAKDDLVKLQKKEKKRRKKIKKSVIKITDQNIIKLSQKSKKKVSKMAGSSIKDSNLISNLNPSEENSSNKTKTKEYWQNEKNRIEDSIRFNEEKIKSLNDKLSKLNSDYLIIDFPPSKNQIKKEITKTQMALNKSKQQIPYLRKLLEELYDRARRENIPPGWLR